MSALGPSSQSALPRPADAGPAGTPATSPPPAGGRSPAAGRRPLVAGHKPLVVASVVVGVLAAGASTTGAHGAVTPVTTGPIVPALVRTENVADGTAGSVVRPNDARLSWVGRWAVSAAGATTVNGGSRLRFSFTGTQVSARLAVPAGAEPPQLYVTVDGHRGQVAARGPVLVLGSGLRPGRHAVLVEVRSMSPDGSRWRRPLTTGLTVTGLDLGPAGRLAARPAPSGIRMEFYGDSVTEGVRAVGDDLTSASEDATASFAALTGSGFGADAVLVGFAGQGLTCPGLGGVPGATTTWGSVLSGVRATGPAPAAVVVNYGANDTAASASRFQTAYTAYLRRVRADYPKAWIFAVTPFDGSHTADVLRAAAALHDRRVVAVDTTGWVPPGDLPDGRHPNAAGHHAAAARLIARIRASTGWRPVRATP